MVANGAEGQGHAPCILEGFTEASKGRLRCNVCNVFCTSKVSAKQHVRGKKHCRRVEREEINSQDIPAGCTQLADGRFHCHICDLDFNRKENLIQHISWKKHLNAVSCGKGAVSDALGLVSSDDAQEDDGIPAGFKAEGKKWLLCILCEVRCNSKKSVSEHVKGKKHRWQCRITALRENKRLLNSPPEGIEMSYSHSFENDELDCEVALKMQAKLTVTVKNKHNRDVLNLRCNLLKDIKAYVKQQKSELLPDVLNLCCDLLEDIKADVKQQMSKFLPGESGAVDINVHGRHVGVFSTALGFLFTWQSQPDQRVHAIRKLRVRCTDDIVKQLQPKTKYKKSKRKWFEPRAEIVDGLRLPMSVESLEHEIKLGWYAIPQGLGVLHNHRMEDWEGITPQEEVQLTEVQDLLESELSPTNHCERFSLLLHCEELQMHIDIRNYDMQGVTMTRCKENRSLLTLQVSGLAENRPSVLKGDCLYVTPLGGYLDGRKDFKGYVHNTKLNEVWLGFHESFTDSFLENSRYNVRFSVNRFPARMHHRSVELERNRMDNVLFPTIASAGTCGETQQVNELTVTNAKQHFKDTRLLENAQQVEAVCNIVGGVSRPAPYLVFGPPGTGKTVTIVEAMKQVLRVLPSSHILACAPSNSASDLLAERLLSHVPTTQMLRMNAGSRSIATVPDRVKPCCNIDQSTRAMFFPSKTKLMKYSIIITTTVTAGRLVSAKFPRGHFTHVFIDEAGHAVEPEALVAIAGIIDSDHGGQIVLAGDPKQLGPVIRSPIARSWGLETSLIERYMETCDIYRCCDDVYDARFVTKLVCNYRSHPAILKLPNECFYDDELKPCADKLLRESLCQWEGLPQKGFPLIFHGVVGADMREENNPSFFNPTEVSVVMDYVDKLLATRGLKVTQTDIGIISPYRKQVQKLQKILKKRRHDDVKTGSVEDFQGQERRVIIISTVRSNPDFLTLDTEYRIGFLDNPKRFNVAVTRAKALLIVVGNPTILAKDKYWDMLLQECCSHGAYTGCELVSGDSAAGDVLQRLADMKLDDIIDDKGSAGDVGTEGEVSAVTRHEGPEWRHDI